MNSTRMPALFIGHGSPMNAIADNTYTQTLNRLGQRLPRPRAILVISAHWMSEGTWVTAMERPKTIHDFYGFPEELFAVQYPAPGSREIADLIRATVHDGQVNLDLEMWGLDHGTWSVLRHLYPKADIPVLQLSLYMEQPDQYHVNLATQLAPLREQGIMIVGSGNLVHNLRRIKWEEGAAPFDWAVEFDDWLKARLQAHDYKALMFDYRASEAGRLSVPTLEHYIPLHYVLGAELPGDTLKFEFEDIQNGSISMRSFSLS